MYAGEIILKWKNRPPDVPWSPTEEIEAETFAEGPPQISILDVRPSENPGLLVERVLRILGSASRFPQNECVSLSIEPRSDDESPFDTSSLKLPRVNQTSSGSWELELALGVSNGQSEGIRSGQPDMVFDEEALSLFVRRECRGGDISGLVSKAMSDGHAVLEAAGVRRLRRFSLRVQSTTIDEREVVTQAFR